MKQLLRLARSPWLLVPLTVLALYAAAGYLLIPFLIGHFAPKLAAEQIKRQLSLGEVRFDPFRLTLEIKDFALKEANGEPLAAFARLFTDLELESLTNRAVTLAEITLEHPVIHAVLDKEGQLNFAKVADALPPSKEPAPPAGEPLPLVIKHTALIDGTIEFIDQSRSKPINETIDAINLEIDTISTLPDTAGSHHIKAKFADGSSLDWQGKIGLNPIQSDGAIRIDGFKLATPWDFVRDQVALNPPGGQLDVAAQYRFHKTPDKLDLGLTSIAVKLAGLQLVPSDTKEPILALDTIQLTDGEFDLSKRTLKIPAFTIQKGRIRADVDQRGEINWQKLAKPAGPPKVPAASAAAPAPSPAAPAGPPWQIEVGGFKIADIGIQFTDASRRSPIELDVGKFGLGFHATIEAGAGEPKVVLDGLGSDLTGIQLKELSRPANLVTLDTLSLKEGRLDLAKHEITLQQVALTGGGTAIERDEKGAIHLLEVLSASDPGQIRRDIKTVKEDAEQQGKPWSIAVKQAAVQGFRTVITDRGVSPALVYGLKDMDLKVNDVVNDGKTPITFAAKLNIEQGGSLTASGTASQKGDRADADVRVDRFELKGLQAFVAQAGALRLEKGDVSTRMHVSFQQGAQGPSLKAKGEITSTNLLLNESKTNKRFVSWKNLAVEGIDFGFEPNKLMIKEIHITEPGTTFEIFEDRTTNVAAIFENKKSTVPQKKAAAPPKAPPKVEQNRKNAPAKAFPVSVQRVRIDDATVDFSDQSLIFPFKTRIQNFGGHVSGISNASTGRTLLKFNGRVDEYGEASLEGQLELMRFKAFSDITLLFRNVDMSSLSPYSGTFAGRRIKSGKLNVEVLYRIEQSKLKSNGKIVLEQLTLGEEVVSPKAKSLPLDLAIALLTDSDGKITVSMPIEGDVDSPTFVYGQVLWDAIVTVLTKAVTAPFTALAGVFGGSEADMAEIFFVPGKDTLPPPEREKLKKVADALAKRPMVTVAVQGGFDPKLDAEALKSRQVRTVITEKLGIALQPGEDPGPVAVNSAKTQKVLEELAAEPGSGGALTEAETAFRKKAAREPKRIGAFSTWLDKASEDAEFYQLLFDRLVANTPLSPKRLETLAEQRGQAIVKELTTRGSLAGSRVRIGNSASVTGSEGRVPAKLDLGSAGN